MPKVLNQLLEKNNLSFYMQLSSPPKFTLCWKVVLHRLWSCTTCIQNLGLTFASCVALDKLGDFSEAQFYHL